MNRVLTIVGSGKPTLDLSNFNKKQVIKLPNSPKEFQELYKSFQDVLDEETMKITNKDTNFSTHTK